MANKKIGKCSFSVFLILDNVRSSNESLGLLSCLYKKMAGNISLKLWREIIVWENKKKDRRQNNLSCCLASCFLSFTINFMV